MTEGLSLGIPEYVALMTLFSVWFVGLNWTWIKCVFPSERKAKRLRKLEGTIILAFESMSEIFKGFSKMSDPRIVLELVNEPTAGPLMRRLRFCQVELLELDIDSPKIPARIKDLQDWLEFLRQLKVLVSAGDHGRCRSWGREMAEK